MMEQVTAAFISNPDENSAAAEAISEEMTRQMLDNMPLRALRSFAGFTEEQIHDLVAMLS